MKKLTLILMTTMLVLAMILTAALSVAAAGTDGFVEEEGGTRYYVGGSYVTGWQVIGEDTYYFRTTNGCMITGTATVGGLTYTFGADGKLAAEAKDGFCEEDGGTRYYIKGTYVTGWRVIEGSKYYFYLASGHMVKESRTIGGVWYEFGSDGKLLSGKNGFVDEAGGTRYYVNDVYATGWQTIGSDTYYFYKSTGYMVTESRTIGGVYYTIGTDGKVEGFKNGFVTEAGGTRYYINSTYLTGWQDIGEDRYYFYKSTGYMVTESRTVGGEWCEFTADGKLIKVRNGFFTEPGGTRYYNDNVYVTGWQTIGDDTYYFYNSTGYLVTESRTIGGIYYEIAADGKVNINLNGFVDVGTHKRYYENGTFVFGWKEVEGKSYYFDLRFGYMTVDTTIEIDGVSYTFKADGTLDTGSDPAADETAAITELLSTNAIWTAKAYAKKYAENVTLTADILMADFEAALGIEGYTVGEQASDLNTLIASYGTAATATPVTGTVHVTVFGTAGGSVEDDITFTLTKVAKGIVVTQAENVTALLDNTPVARNHGGHQTRVLRTSYGTFIVYLTRTDLLGTDGHWEFIFAELDGEDSRIIYRDYTPYDGVYVMCDADENIYLVTGTSTTRYDWYDPETAQATVWQYNRADDTVQGYTTRIPFSAGFSHGYMAATLDTVTNKMYILYSGGGGSEYSYYSWMTFDLATKQYDNNVRYISLGQARRFCYSYMFPDGKGGMKIVGERDISQIALKEIHGIGNGGSTYAFDQLHLFTISDLSASSPVTYNEVTIRDGSYTKYQPNIQNNTMGDTYIDDLGNIHVIYTAKNETVFGCLVYRTIYSSSGTRLKSGKLSTSSLFPESSNGYAIRMAQDSSGNYYLLSFDYNKTAILKLYKCERTTTAPNGTGTYKLIGSYDLGIDKLVTYDAITVSSPRNNSRDDKIDCLVAIPGGTASTPENSVGVDYYHFTVDFDGYDVD